MKLSTILTFTPLTLETSNGEIELMITKFTIADADRRQKLMAEIFDNSDATELDKYNAVQIARIMSSVKHIDTGAYFWQGGVVDFKAMNYEMDFINALAQAVNDVNPIPKMPEDGTTAFDSKKKQS